MGMGVSLAVWAGPALGGEGGGEEGLPAPQPSPHTPKPCKAARGLVPSKGGHRGDTQTPTAHPHGWSPPSRAAGSMWGSSSPFTMSIPALGSLPSPLQGPYPSLHPCARAARGGSCGGPQCAASSPRARPWSRGTACRCSGPACAPTRCGCWTSVLQGREKREARRPPARSVLGGAVLEPPRWWETCRVRGGRPQVPAASCWVLWGSDQTVLWGQEHPHSEPHMHGVPSPRMKPQMWQQEARLCPLVPTSLCLSVVSPHPMERSFQLQGWGGSSPSSCGSSFSCCFCPWAPEEPARWLPGVPLLTPHLQPYLGSIPSPQLPKMREPALPLRSPGVAQPRGASPSPCSPPAAHRPPKVTESSPQPVGAKLTCGHS